MIQITKKCSSCGAGFATGKEYSNYWVQFTNKDLPLGLCEFCNPAVGNKWYIKYEEKLKQGL